VSWLRRLIGEAHRRSLWQVLGIYVVTSWVIYQVVVALWEGLGLPEWVPPTALILLLIGLPIVLATAFVQEGGPELRRGSDAAPVPGLESATDAVAPAEPAYAVSPDQAKPGSDRRAGVFGLFTWSRAITGGVLGFAILGLATTGFMGMRAMGIGPAATLISKGVLEERTRILVAEFDSPPADSLLAAAVTEAMRIDLGQSRALNVVDPSEIPTALARMQLPPTTRLGEAVVRELAIREGIPAVLVGELTPVGPGYQITARLITPDTGTVLIRARQTARAPEDVLAAVDRITATVLERAGESFRSIRATPPLAAYTTSSLEALQLFGQARRVLLMESDYERAGDLLEEAVARDSTFAMAWRMLGAVQTNIGRDFDRVIEAYTRAARLSDRLPEAERQRVLGDYYRQVDYQPERAIAAFERYAELTGDLGSLNNLALLYSSIGEHARAAEVGARAAAADSAALPLGNAVLWSITAGDLDAAARAYEARRRLFPDNPTNHLVGGALAYARGDAAAFDALVEEGKGQRSLASRQAALLQESWHALRDGRLAEGYSSLDERTRLVEREGLGPDDMRPFWRGWSSVFLLGDLAAASAYVDTILQDVLPSMSELDRPYLPAATLAAVSGRLADARALVDEWERITPEGLRRRDATFHMLGRGLIDVGEGRTEQGFEAIRRATEGTGDAYIALPFLAWAYDVAGRADSALDAYKRYEASTHGNRLLIDAIFLGLAYERMAQIHEDRGERSEAAVYYSRFIDLWRDADMELQPRVQSAQRALARLTDER
jgi:eukaryotic-like serine/threonine-protein kinase